MNKVYSYALVVIHRHVSFWFPLICVSLLVTFWVRLLLRTLHILHHIHDCLDPLSRHFSCIPRTFWFYYHSTLHAFPIQNAWLSTHSICKVLVWKYKNFHDQPITSFPSVYHNVSKLLWYEPPYHALPSLLLLRFRRKLDIYSCSWRNRFHAFGTYLLRCLSNKCRISWLAQVHRPLILRFLTYF